ncbi:MAG: hypothetical protein WCO65_03735 [bacterium]
MKKRTPIFLISVTLLLIGIFIPLQLYSYWLTLSDVYFIKSIFVLAANIVFMYAVSKNERGRNPLSNNNELLAIFRVIVIAEWLTLISLVICAITTKKINVAVCYNANIIMYVSFVFYALVCAFNTSDTKHY